MKRSARGEKTASPTAPQGPEAAGPLSRAVPLDKSGYEALAAFRYTLRHFVRESEERARGAGLTPQQFQLLLAVKGQPGRDWATVTELAQTLQVRHHAAVGLVTRCALRHLVRRDPDPLDRRQVRVSLTARGAALLAAVAAANRGELEALLGALQALLRREITNLPQAAEAADDGGGEPPLPGHAAGWSP